ncbi:MAG TPA: carboxypeptidase-like regulatory domain-containing protein, partial [Candidatus Acidoferrales bacterium]
MKIRRAGIPLVTVLLWAVTPLAVFGQNVNGKISGIVSDSSGAAIGQATVALTNLDTNAKSQTSTDSSGNYSFPNVSPGRYKLQAEKSGFK